jgi:hypothetical protein
MENEALDDIITAMINNDGLRLGIKMKFLPGWNDFDIFVASQIMFDSDEDMNLYKLTGTLKESSYLWFTVL